MKYAVTLQIRVVEGGAVPDNLIEKYSLLETEDIEYRDRFVKRVMEAVEDGEFDDD